MQFINENKRHVYNNERDVTLNSSEISPDNLPKIKDKDFDSHNKNESNIGPNTTVAVVDVNIKQEYQDVIKSPGEKMELRRSNRINLGKQPERYKEYSAPAKETKEPRTIQEALTAPDKENWKLAIKEELDSLKANATWELVNATKRSNIIGSKWVFKLKHNEAGDVTRYKARLVAQGFSQKFGIDYDEVFAPVVRQTTVRTLLTKAGCEKWKVKHLDAKTAFLNGELQETR
ncbi:pol polyprotein [Lasius niger]|uniref:Pol polyprotein n=1 Tax=Lasius niger TaxID=67767 RepID=A0A0J7K396_LASNI|nr:pol polyprotein [Lasius niger]